MRKGVDLALFRKVRVDNNTGKIVEDRLVWRRPAFGVKELARRKKARKAARIARRDNRG